LQGLVSSSGLDPRQLRQFEVVGHLRRLGRDQSASDARSEDYRSYRKAFGLSGPAELPAGFTFVRKHQRER
jgi:hypothetical protein